MNVGEAEGVKPAGPRVGDKPPRRELVSTSGCIEGVVLSRRLGIVTDGGIVLKRLLGVVVVPVGKPLTASVGDTLLSEDSDGTSLGTKDKVLLGCFVGAMSRVALLVGGLVTNGEAKVLGPVVDAPRGTVVVPGPVVGSSPILSSGMNCELSLGVGLRRGPN